VRHNMAIDTDVLSAGFRQPTVRRSFLRYTDAICAVPLASTVEGPAPRLRCCSGAAGVRAVCVALGPGTTARFGLVRNQRPSSASRPDRAAMKKCAISSTRECSSSQAARGPVGSKLSVAPRGLQKASRYNRSIDTDGLSAGFAGLLSAGHLQRYTDASFVGRPISAAEVLGLGARLKQGTTARFGNARAQRPSGAACPERTVLKQSAKTAARECRPSEAGRGLAGHRLCFTPRGSKCARHNLAVDTDALRRPLPSVAPGASRRSPLRYTARPWH
jgi:hypothetical protein